MSIVIQFYNVLDDKLFNKLGYTAQPPIPSYINEDYEEILMTLELVEGQENTYQVTDPKVHWDANIHNLSFQQEIVINNTTFLFGNGGLVPKDSTIGIAFRWHSKDSSQRTITPVGEVSQDFQGPLSVNIEINIPKGTLRGRVTFEIVLYLLDSGDVNQRMIPGTVLGVLDSFEILFDGDSSMFPIVEVNDPTKPLWWVDCDFDDPLYEQFTVDNVSIVLNMGHKLSRNLKIEKGISSSPLLVEIIASGLQLIIEKVKDMGEWQQLPSGESETGSIGEAIYYFINTFSWDVSSPERLAKSIREDFDNRFK